MFAFQDLDKFDEFDPVTKLIEAALQIPVMVLCILYTKEMEAADKLAAIITIIICVDGLLDGITGAFLEKAPRATCKNLGWHLFSILYNAGLAAVGVYYLDKARKDYEDSNGEIVAKISKTDLTTKFTNEEAGKFDPKKDGYYC